MRLRQRACLRSCFLASTYLTSLGNHNTKVACQSGIGGSTMRTQMRASTHHREERLPPTRQGKIGGKVAACHGCCCARA
eukprot:scaffold92055_cov33-Tisochrysis_lutea.AAC.2